MIYLKFKCSYLFYIQVFKLLKYYILIVMGYAYTKMLFIVYLKFKFLPNVLYFICQLQLWPTQTAKVSYF